jgi:hypothetical protein
MASTTAGHYSIQENNFQSHVFNVEINDFFECFLSASGSHGTNKRTKETPDNLSR